MKAKVLLPEIILVLFLAACGAPALRTSLGGVLPYATPTAPQSTAPNVDLPASANPANGKQLVGAFHAAAGTACTACHRFDSDERLIGPGLRNVSIRAQTRVKGKTAIEYLRESIVNPSAYVVEGYPDIMPKNWGKVFTDAEINDIIASVFTLSSSS